MPAVNLKELKYIIDSVDEADLETTHVVIDTSDGTGYRYTVVEAVLTDISKDENKEELVLVIR